MTECRKRYTKLIRFSRVQRSKKGRLNPWATLDPGILNPGAVELAAVIS